jgi:5-methylthioribose kinase
MSNFTKHFKMLEPDAAAYAKEKGFFAGDAELVCKEIGDGNINYVFRVLEPATGRSVIIKHADIILRLTGRKLSLERSRIEAEVYAIYNKLAPGLVPEIFLYDPIMCCIVMQDLRDYENMRYALTAGKTFSTFADDISTFMAQTLMRTTDSIMNLMDKKFLVRDFINPEMCLISERLVFTEPYTNHEGTNVSFKENAEFLQRELYEDEALGLEAAKLKEAFKSNAQALIHGDLHTGSIFVKEGSTMVLDPEFAFYGPIGYDVGNVIANLLFAWVNAEVAMCGEAKQTFQAWAENAITQTTDLFYQKSLRILKEESTDRMAKTKGFAEWFMDTVMADTAGMAGMEINRRIIGIAKVADIAGIQDPLKRERAEQICVLCAKEFIMGRGEKYRKGHEYVDTMKQTASRLAGDTC